MASSVNLVAFAGDQPWSVLLALTHWHRADRTLRRVCLFAATDDTRPAANAARLVRFLKESHPDLRVELRTGSSDPGSVRSHLEVWHRGDPSAEWVLNITGAPEATAWAAEPWIGRNGCRVVQRRADGSWTELRRDADGRVQAEALTEIRRESTDTLSLASLLRAFRALETSEASSSDGDLVPAEPLPLVPLTEAVIRADWNWRQAFDKTGLAAAQDTDDRLFQRYLAAFLAGLGIAQAGSTTSRCGMVWANQGGRLLAIDASLASDDLRADTTADSEAGTGGSTSDAARQPLAALSALARQWPGIPVDLLWIRPTHRTTPADRELAGLLGIRILDETDGPDLPSRLARWVGQPLSADATEIERLLRHHLAASGRMRVFGPESSILRGPSSREADPVVAEVEHWLEQVRVARRQNWQAWRHAGRLAVRIPAAGASSPSDDWRLLVAAVLRIGPEELNAEATAGTVTLTMADAPDLRRRLAAWFRPFLNSNLTFVAARDRLAAEAKAAMEAAGAPPPRELPSRSAPTAASSTPSTLRRPSAPGASTGTGTGTGSHRPPPPPPAKPKHKPKTVSLDDLDRALDDALGG